MAGLEALGRYDCPVSGRALRRPLGRESSQAKTEAGRFCAGESDDLIGSVFPGLGANLHSQRWEYSFYRQSPKSLLRCEIEKGSLMDGVRGESPSFPIGIYGNTALSPVGQH